MISDLLDIPVADRPHLRHLIDLILGVTDTQVSDRETSARAVVETFQYTMDLGEQRRAHPGEDITSHLMLADVDASAA